MRCPPVTLGVARAVRLRTRGDDLTTDDHTCVLLLDDVVLRQVLGTRDADDRAMLIRLNLAAAGVPSLRSALIGRGRAAPAAAADPTAGPTAADRARHPSAGRHARLDAPEAAPRHGDVAHHTAA